jgi:shikimate kinase / 3-dehydroquinate synthase
VTAETGSTKGKAIARKVREALGARSVVLVGMMGSGKSSIGRRLAALLDLPFNDADTAIEQAAGMTIEDIFRVHGEPYFRDGEERVIRRLLHTGPQVLATGGGAVLSAKTRAEIASTGVSIWLKAPVELLLQRVSRRDNRPLLKMAADPRAVIEGLLAGRTPFYAMANLTVESRDTPHETVVDEVLSQLGSYLTGARGQSPAAISQERGAAMAAGTEAGKGVRRLDVALGARSYPILIGSGLLNSAPAHLRNALPDARFAIVADRAVQNYADGLAENLSREGILLGPACFVAPGESSKCFPELERVCRALLDLGIERRHAVIALGGGVIGDLAGFAAAIVKRGVRLVQVPTTLLAQVDSSVGGKTGINAGHGKNLIGAFHQPSLVLADLGTLETLPPREFRSGYAEIVKYGVLGDAAFFEWLDARGTGVSLRDPEALTRAIETSCRMKADIVARDETETGDRALLNLGHTFGHAVEAWAGYSGALLHGEGVALGMVLAAKFSASQGLCSNAVPLRLEYHLKRFDLATDFQALGRQTGRMPDLDSLLAFMEQDKKVKDGEMTLVLLRRIGEAFIAPKVTRPAIRAFLEAELAK